MILVIFVRSVGEGDGRCVRASGPVSTEHSTFYLLLNPPSMLCVSAQFPYFLD